MLLLIVFVIIGFIIGIWTDLKYGICISRGILGSIIGLCIGVPVALSLPADLELVVNTYEIEALQDGNNVLGSFFLGSGMINGKMQYVFYYKVEQEESIPSIEILPRFKMDQVPYWKGEIQYISDSLTPYVEQYKESVTDSWINYFAIDCLKYDWYVFYVPKGTIKKDYLLDTK